MSILHTKRLILRPFKEDDAAAMYKNWTYDSRVSKYCRWTPHTSLEATEHLLKIYLENDEFRWAITLTDSDEPIGVIDVVDLSEDRKTASIGYALSYNHWNRGYATEALSKVIEYLFQNGFETIRADHKTGNTASGRVMEKCGMKYVGTAQTQEKFGSEKLCEVKCYQISNKYRIINSDLDGTMLDNASHLSEANLDAIKKLTNRGVLVVPSSGRTYCDMPNEIKENPYFRYLIHSNGAVIIDNKTGERYLQCVPSDISRQMFEIINKFDCHITIRHNGACLVDKKKQSPEAYEYYNVQKGHGELVNLYADFSDNFADECLSLKNIEQLSVFFHSNEERMQCKSELLQFGELLVAEAYDYNLEICYVKAGKGNALKKLAEITGVALENTIAVGDSDNDVTALTTAGLGLAVKNACSALLDVADQIICTNEENAIEYILKKYY